MMLSNSIIFGRQSFLNFLDTMKIDLTILVLKNFLKFSYAIKLTTTFFLLKPFLDHFEKNFNRFMLKIFDLNVMQRYY